MGTAHARNDAEAARMVAALRDFQVGGVARSKPETRRGKIGNGFGTFVNLDQRWGRQPETIKPWPRFLAARNSADSRIVSTLSSWAASMNEQVLTMTASAEAASLVTSTPALSNFPSMISASTRFLAQPREIRPT